MLYLCLFIENKKKLAVGVTLEFSHKPGSVTSCFVRKNRAEKSSDWLSTVGHSMEDGDATYV